MIVMVAEGVGGVGSGGMSGQGGSRRKSAGFGSRMSRSRFRE